MNCHRLPLPLELTKPVLLAGDLDSLFRAGLDTYDPRTQLSCNRGGGKSTSHQQCSVQDGVNADIVSVDVQVDDVLVA
jgi:hypothetical protein